MPKPNHLATALVLAMLLGVARGVVLAAPLAATAPPLGDAASFSVLAALSMSAAGAGTTVEGDLGLSPGLASSRTGAWTVLGSEYFGTVGPSADAQADALIAHGNMAGQTTSGTWLLNPAPVPGVWTDADSAVFPGPTLTLNGGPLDVWVFQIGADFNFTGAVILTGGAQACNVFWQIGNSAVIASGSAFVGTLIASADVTLTSGAIVDGRIMSLNGALTTDGNSVFGPDCGANATSTSVVQTATSAAATATSAAATSVVQTATSAAATGTSAAATNVAATSTSAAATALFTPPPDTPVPPPPDTPVPAPTLTPSPAPTTAPTVPAVVGLPPTGGAPLQRGDSSWFLVLVVGGFSALALGLTVRAQRRRVR